MKSVGWGFASLALATMIGAFGTHSLRGHIDESALTVFQTGQQYHVTGSLALILVGLLQVAKPNLNLTRPAVLLGIGIVVFSGTLYALALTGIRILGAITPIGGPCMIVAYAWTAWSAFRSPKG